MYLPCPLFLPFSQTATPTGTTRLATKAAAATTADTVKATATANGTENAMSSDDTASVIGTRATGIARGSATHVVHAANTKSLSGACVTTMTAVTASTKTTTREPPVGSVAAEGEMKRMEATEEGEENIAMRRSPTPSDAVPISQRKRKASGWDVHAPGYEQYTAMQAKQTGLFNLPGANRTQIPPILAIPGLPPPLPVQSFGMGIGGNPNLSRQSRRLYIGSITPDINEQNLAEFFNSKMKEMNIGTGAPGNPVLAVQCNYEKNYAFVEFRSAEDATAAMAFDGIIFLNGPLKIRRPKDYGGPDAMAPNMHVPGVVSTNVPDSINKIFVGGLPTYLNEEQVMELLKSFGDLKAFNLVRENGNGPSKGFAFFEYVDTAVTDVAIQSLSGMELGDKYLVVQRASVGAKPGQSPIPEMYDQVEIPRPILPAGDVEGTDARILLMLNMVTPEDLTDDQEYADMYEDIKEECSKYGAVEDLRIPRPVKRDKAKWGEGGPDSAMAAQRMDEAAGVGRVYVRFTESHSAGQALKALAGRSFAGRSIIATLLSDDSNTTPPLNLIFAPQPEAPPPLPQD
ncbi:uncharacterized protein LAESUDRAFT_645827 [Laetiporus sulphureus 93-53]|uniref:Splicing factor U2AF subunit n=1 Tax=Laetiporus sulphureus 93-53 TaxID=1314785 RepID=A0A165GAS0_9APHY|nr:uncharacterized protein LAESUDRAFT_645827 [Laetiporus sulphureus 93-53]KZT10083.1 hypothetical protein LAESUDRAFT_645827 [Laetiporus sulphureus 93-53]